MSSNDRIKTDYPWVSTPLVASAPMRLIALAPLAVEVSRAGGVGFIGAGNDTSDLATNLENAQHLLQSSPIPSRDNVLPIGVGFLNWGADLSTALDCLQKYRPAAAWFFAPRKLSDLMTWTQRTREETQRATKIWIQVGTVANALEVVKACEPDVLVVQGADAGGHGLDQGAGIVALLPEVVDALNAELEKGGINMIPTIVATGGIADGRGLAAAVILGASGIVMGTRYLVSHEAQIARGYKDEVIRAADGGVNTVRSSVYDILRGTTDWPPGYGGRGIINQSYHDAMSGMDVDKNKGLYAEAVKLGDKGWGVQGRMTTYAGTAIGLVKKVQSAKEITEEVREEGRRVLRGAGSKL